MPRRSPSVRDVPADLALSEVDFAGRRVFLLSYASASAAAGGPPRAEPWCRLTPAELAIAQLLVGGKTPSWIARERGTSVRTVTKQIESAYKRLGVHSRTELALLFCAQRGATDVD
jgi:DNA-binding NarL/FixJ family response regulator